MPVHLPALSRRRFLHVAAASLGALAAGHAFGGDDKTDPHRLALLSDTHVGDRLETVARENNMADNLRKVVAEVAALGPKPAAVVLDGDMAYKDGTPDEYRLFGQLIEPLRQAGLPLHLTLGNHDNRDKFLGAFAAAAPRERPVEGKHVLVVELERANLFLLDSLEPKRGSNGECGAKQREWLAKALDARPKKPAVVFAHHNLTWTADGKGFHSGLTDVPDFWPVLKERKQVKAYVFGHTHTWKLDVKDEIHLINLPAIGYPFSKGVLTGWVDVVLKENGVALEVHGLDAKHADHGKKADLTWR
jgi:3',5'-cyclic AMP phosphodiesterase CpdA